MVEVTIPSLFPPERVRQQKLSMEVLAPASAKHYKAVMKPVPSQSASSFPHNPQQQTKLPASHSKLYQQQHLAVTTPANAMTTLIRYVGRELSL